MELIKVGIIGCGRISKAHVKALSTAAGVELVGVCDRASSSAIHLFAVRPWLLRSRNLSSRIRGESLRRKSVTHVSGINRHPCDRNRPWKIGVPTGIRTPVAAVKGRCPRPLDDGDPGNWWSQTGSNRRPLACHASALPAELWPHSEGANSPELPPKCQRLQRQAPPHCSSPYPAQRDSFADAPRLA